MGPELIGLGAWYLPEDVAVLSLCACPVSVAILTYLVVASPLSDTVSGNLAGTVRLWGPGQGGIGMVT